MKLPKKGFLLLATGIYLASFPSLILAGPTSTNFELKQYSFGGGSTDNSSSTNYSLNATLGELESGQTESLNYVIGGGLNYILQANVPPAPIFTNPDNYYNKLKIVINEGGNPSNATYAIAISTDNFIADTRYVATDGTITNSFGPSIFQTYSAWGGASGSYIIGLSPNVTYTVKIKAERGNFTETGWGPTAQASTISPTLSFDLDVAATDTPTSPPYILNIGNLTPSSVITSTDKVWATLSTNATGGGMIYVKGANTGLASSTASYTISSNTADLSVASSGYGIRSSSTTENTGGPMQAIAPYNGVSDNVGIADTNIRLIYDSSGNAVDDGRVSFELKAKSTSTTPAAPDYTDTLTLTATGSF